MEKFGRVVEGSVNDGIKILLEHDENIERYPIGSLIAVDGELNKYLAIITDCGVEAHQETQITLMAPVLREDLRCAVSKALRERTVGLKLKAVLVAQASKNQSEEGGAITADTMPNFFSPARNLGGEEILTFFGVADEEALWNIGIPKTPKGLMVEIPIDVNKLANLSFGIFGKSGTGKSVLGNIIASSILLYSVKKKEPIKLLIFDMHSEYGLELKDQRGDVVGDGVGKIFAEQFLRYSPDENLVRERGLEPFAINYSHLTVEDIRMIAPVFGLSETFLSHLSDYERILRSHLENYWLWGFLLNEGDEAMLNTTAEGRSILQVISEKASSLRDMRDKIEEDIKEKMGFPALTSFKSQSSKLRRLLLYPFTPREEDSVDEIIKELTSRNGRNVCISLGRFEKETPLYMVMANLIARRLRKTILEKVSRGEQPETRIIIFLEEAHNFLGRETYRESPFGDVAREMRKRGVIICVIDQKPGELDPDVISMLWTNFVFNLTDPRDVDAAVSGSVKSNLFAKMIPNLPKREVFIYGEAVNFPVVIKVKEYREAERTFKEEAEKISLEINRRISELREGGIL